MFTATRSLFSFVVLSSLSSTWAALTDPAPGSTPPAPAPATPPATPATPASPNAPAPAPAPAPHPGSTGPQCAALCTKAKLEDAAKWWGQSEVHVYCRYPEFLTAFNTCAQDNCKPDELEAAKQAGQALCAGVQPNAGNSAEGKNGTATATVDPNNPAGTARPPLSGPANAPGSPDNTTVSGKPGTNPGSPVVSPTGTGVTNGANATNGTSSTPNAVNGTSGTNRFSGAVGSAAANASTQGNSATGISPSSAFAFTAVSSCILFMIL